MQDDDDKKGASRRALLLCAWTAPVVASFALGGLAAAATFQHGNVSVNMLSQTANGIRSNPTKK